MSRSLAPNALTTVAAVRDGFTAAQSDDEIIRLINARAARFEQRTGRHFGFFAATTDAAEYIEGNAQYEIYVKARPIRTITRIRIGGWVYAQGWIGLEITDWQYTRTAERDERGAIYRLPGWPAVVPEWDSLDRDPDMRRMNRMQTVEVCYTGGWILPQFDGVADAVNNPLGLPTDLPSHIEDGCIREVRHTLRRPWAGQVEERTAEGWSQRWSDKSVMRPTEFDTETEMMLDAESLPGAFYS